MNKLRSSTEVPKQDATSSDIVIREKTRPF